MALKEVFFNLSSEDLLVVINSFRLKKLKRDEKSTSKLIHYNLMALFSIHGFVHDWSNGT